MSACPTSAPFHDPHTPVPSSLSHPSTAWEMGHTQKLLNKREWGVIMETGVHRW